MFKYFTQGRDPISSYTHALGAIFSLVATLILVVTAVTRPQPTLVCTFSVAVFGLSLVALYSASAYYHFVKRDERTMLWLRKLDHSMIYVLIAGSYTPMVLNFFPPQRGKLFTLVIWSFALVGIIIKLCWMNAPRWLSTSLYLLMGWAIVWDVSSLLTMPQRAIALLAVGGVCYTIGGVIYWVKHPNFSEGFGFHELFHIFVMLGSFFHFLVVYLYVL